MKKHCAAFLTLAAIFFMLVTAWAAGQSLVVQLQTTSLRAAPSFTGKVVASLSYGQIVTAREEKGSWLLVNTPSVQGWLHRSAVSEKNFSLLPGTRNTAAGADAREVSMAGKGFDQVETAYRQGNPNGYADLEKMLHFRYTPEESMAFLAAGRGRTQ